MKIAHIYAGIRFSHGQRVWSAVLIAGHERWRGHGFSSKRNAVRRARRIAELLKWEIEGVCLGLEV